jgi:hypothetical protein
MNLWWTSISRRDALTVQHLSKLSTLQSDLFHPINREIAESLHAQLGVRGYWSAVQKVASVSAVEVGSHVELLSAALLGENRIVVCMAECLLSTRCNATMCTKDLYSDVPELVDGEAKDMLRGWRKRLTRVLHRPVKNGEGALRLLSECQFQLQGIMKFVSEKSEQRIKFLFILNLVRAATGLSLTVIMSCFLASAWVPYMELYEQLQNTKGEVQRLAILNEEFKEEVQVRNEEGADSVMPLPVNSHFGLWESDVSNDPSGSDTISIASASTVDSATEIASHSNYDDNSNFSCCSLGEVCFGCKASNLESGTMFIQDYTVGLATMMGPSMQKGLDFMAFLDHRQKAGFLKFALDEVESMRMGDVEKLGAHCQIHIYPPHMKSAKLFLCRCNRGNPKPRRWTLRRDKLA